MHSIVLGEGRRVVMADLRGMAEDLGYRNCRTLASTGNLVFETPSSPVGDIERALEGAFAKRFGRHVDIIVRSGPDWTRLAAGNPFRGSEGSKVGVRVMRQPLDRSVLAVLERYCTDERISLVGGDLWVDFGIRASETRLLSALTTRRLGIGTMRNANTVAGLAEMTA